MTGMIIALAALAAGGVLSLTTDVLEIFAPVLNSGSAVIAVAFITGVFVYRWVRNRKKKD
jgi:hypothetical protein